jgi:3-deoxy-D-manno-octulosonic-acid transferase
MIRRSLLREPYNLLVGGRQRWSWFLGHWGIYPRGVPQGGLWVHTRAMGEIRVAISLVQALPEELPVVITVEDSPEARLARKLLGKRAEVTFLPFPVASAIRRFLRKFSPRRLVLVETEDLRPLLLLDMVRREIPAAVVSGQLSEMWFKGREHFLPLLHNIDVFGVRDEENREYLTKLGIPRERVSLTGNLKFDAVIDPRPELEAQLKELAAGRPVLIAASTHIKEDPQVLEAFESLGGGGRAMLILAPRWHFRTAERNLIARGADFVKRSSLPVSGRPAIVLLDGIGEMASLFRIATAAFVGYSLIPDGPGRNPIEPASVGVPIAVGLNTRKVEMIAEMFDHAGAWQRIADGEELARTWGAWLDDPERARQMGRKGADLVVSQRGIALSRTLELLRPFLGLNGVASVSRLPSSPF